METVLSVTNFPSTTLSSRPSNAKYKRIATVLIYSINSYGWIFHKTLSKIPSTFLSERNPHSCNLFPSNAQYKTHLSTSSSYFFCTNYICGFPVFPKGIRSSTSHFVRESKMQVEFLGHRREMLYLDVLVLHLLFTAVSK